MPLSYPRTPRSAPSGAPRACACGRLRRAARALTQLYDDAIAPAGLRIGQFSLLRTLTRDGSVRISDLAGRQLLDRTALSRNLDPLVAQGYVEVVRGRDSRTREVAITRKGSAALRAAEPHWTRAQREVARRLGAERLEALIDTLAELEALHPARGAPTSGAVRGNRPSVTGRGNSHNRPQARK